KIKSNSREWKIYFAGRSISGGVRAGGSFLETGSRRAAASHRNPDDSLPTEDSFSVQTRSPWKDGSRRFAHARNGGGENK
ncbi:MAG TPA: hypothetical protein VMD27_14005, partial [Candidatus Aquilonibacter sp.]|nr:hypothetical protein [Candidatus Aquilonibacter sp.]